ncbi:SDR family oxidoreductase [Pseudooceanicola sp. CBS1P-1]|uniref:SDR family oxidoreductase n=1 Tax=Pseudooceanicola albus TaxID=2692189 RepID=A0A6L7G6T8_9RHOB|nr:MULTISPECIES: SDR family oxidoreductase [Pseudooceanicola]MBT9384119.1 SDR family oxidoreductase [Pseudooceanicola endophyticus]MXN19781.1 SDR family oxidoreductase [Pseudooceanicola albus]
MTTDPNRLDGQSILLTGASGGIGQAIATRLVALGAHPVLHYGRNRAAAEALRARLGQGTLVQADLSDPDGATQLWTRAQEARGRLHALVNNAGLRAVARITDPLDTWQQAWEADLRVNLLAPADLVRCAIPHFAAHGGGRIVSIASRAAQRGYTADHMPYGASKAGLINLMKSVARNHGAEGITALSIAPGFVRTEMAEDFIRSHGKAAAVGDIPIAEMVEPEELAQLVAFALLPSQRSLNGATLDMNGGSYLR